MTKKKALFTVFAVASRPTIKSMTYVAKATSDTAFTRLCRRRRSACLGLSPHSGAAPGPLGRDRSTGDEIAGALWGSVPGAGGSSLTEKCETGRYFLHQSKCRMSAPENSEPLPA